MRNSGVEAARVVAFAFIYIENMPTTNAPPWAETALFTNILLLTGKVAVAFFLVAFGFYLAMRLKSDGSAARIAVERNALLRLWWPPVVVAALATPFISDVPHAEMTLMIYNITSAAKGYHDAFMPLWTIVMCFQCCLVWIVIFRITRNVSTIVLIASGWIAVAALFGLYLDSNEAHWIEYNYKSPITHGAAICLGVILCVKQGVISLWKTWWAVALLLWAVAVLSYVLLSTNSGISTYTLTQFCCIGVGALIFLRSMQYKEDKRLAKLAPFALAFYVSQAPINWYFVVNSFTDSWTINTLLALMFTVLFSIALTKTLFQWPKKNPETR